MEKEPLGSPLTVRFSKSITQQLKAMEDRAAFIREAVAEQLAKEMGEWSAWSLEELNAIAKDVGS
ncbi:hypothetical protein [Lyngbya confervoides]|uniref:CopG family transcriptional regulator n=1 Tax=Lyngbya confervoides BDU141951 TaxID=1574623 RepID=A0ABD4T1Z1_9CYAN|nr:hypothetical protein [Lyngbya confervoides]MCM1982549.1 hypothetical protein [Lyngbya confervoides BDU141951]